MEDLLLHLVLIETIFPGVVAGARWSEAQAESQHSSCDSQMSKVGRWRGGSSSQCL